MTSKRGSRFGFRVTEKELKVWKMVAELEGLSLSSWLTMLANQRSVQVAAMRNAERQ